MKSINLFIIFCLFISLKISAQIIVVYDPVIPDTIDIDEIAEADTIFEDEDTITTKSGCPDCPGTSNCKEPEEKKLADKLIKFHTWYHRSGGIIPPSAVRKFKSAPSFRVLRFDALFHESTIYTTSDPAHQTDWNKLMKISSEQCEGQNYYLTLGWRYRPDLTLSGASEPGAIELGLYSHIDQRSSPELWFNLDASLLCNDGIKGTESISLEKYIPKADFEPSSPGQTVYAGRPVELVFYNKGFFVRVGERGIAIRRDFTKETCPLCEPAKTRMRKSGYFGGDENPPHKMKILVEDIYADYEPTWWTHTSYKGFSRSEWYDGDVQTYFASEKIELNLPIEAPASANLEDGKSFIRFKSGCDITFITPDLEPPHTIDPITGLINDFYGEGIVAEVGAEVKHYPTCPPGMDCTNTGEVFEYTCPDGKGLKLHAETDTTDYLTEEMLIKDDKLTETFEIHPNPNNGNMQVVYEIPETETGIFEIYNLIGKKLLSYPLYGGKNTFSISVTMLKEGIYFYRATAGNKQIAADKIVVIK